MCLHVQVQREIRIHSQLQHEHIIALYAAFEDAEHVYLALEYANGANPPLRAPVVHIPFKYAKGACFLVMLAVVSFSWQTSLGAVLMDHTDTLSATACAFALLCAMRRAKCWPALSRASGSMCGHWGGG